MPGRRRDIPATAAVESPTLDSRESHATGVVLALYRVKFVVALFCGTPLLIPIWNNRAMLACRHLLLLLDADSFAAVVQ